MFISRKEYREIKRSISKHDEQIYELERKARDRYYNLHEQIQDIKAEQEIIIDKSPPFAVRFSIKDVVSALIKHFNLKIEEAPAKVELVPKEEKENGK